MTSAGVLGVLGVPGVLGCLVLGVLEVHEVPRAQRTPSVKDVLRRVAAYVDSYGERAAVVVATEEYTQQARDGGPVPATRRIRADFAIVKVDAIRGWQGFRDVLEVDGQRLPDRDDRLVRLLTTAGGGYDEARRLSDESARFNIGEITRNFNVPTTALFFFTRANQDRFKFSAKGVDPAGLWEIAYEEASRPTMIRTPQGVSLPCKGKLWVNPADGTVVRTRLEVEGFSRGSEGPRGIGQVDVTYQYVEAIRMWLPASMDEDFARGRGLVVGSISGRALYSNYRQFTTSGRIK
jgi:hypothetical protein